MNLTLINKEIFAEVASPQPSSACFSRPFLLLSPYIRCMCFSQSMLSQTTTTIDVVRPPSASNHSQEDRTQNQVVHFVGFGNRLVADPTLYDRQVLYIFHRSCLHVLIQRNDNKNATSQIWWQETWLLLPKFGGRKHGSLWFPFHPQVEVKIKLRNHSAIKNLANMEWRCPICEVSAPSEQGLQDHLAGKKHESKVAALKASNTETELLEKKMEWTWMCPICKIGMKSDANFQSHLARKKHKANVAIRKGKII
ncbi:hypothetical protein LXL04_008318 [Taraxacum kok-saghyz]